MNEPVGQCDDIRLPSLSVSNRTDEPTVFSVDATYIGDQEELAADPAWFRFDPERFTLEPGAGQVVNVRMNIPRDAKPGNYRVLLRARAEPPEAAGGGTVISAAVATTLLFTVENRNFHFYDPLVDFFQDRSPFSYIGLGLLALAVAIELLRRRFRLRISLGVERRE